MKNTYYKKRFNPYLVDLDFNILEKCVPLVQFREMVLKYISEIDICMNLRSLVPFIVSLGGVLLDYVTTTIGLSLGFRETHPHYSPVYALLIFWGCLTILHLTLPKAWVWRLNIHIIAFLSYLGAVNNLLVLLPYLLSI